MEETGKPLSEILKFIYPEREVFLLVSSAFEKFVKAYYAYRAFIRNVGLVRPEELKRLVEDAFHEAVDNAYALSVDSFSAERGAVNYFMVPKEFRNGFTAALYHGGWDSQYMILEKGTLSMMSFWGVSHVSAFSEDCPYGEVVISEETLLHELEVLASALHHILEEHNTLVEEINGYLEENGISPIDYLERLDKQEYNAVRGVFMRVVRLIKQKTENGCL